MAYDWTKKHISHVCLQQELSPCAQQEILLGAWKQSLNTIIGGRKSYKFLEIPRKSGPQFNRKRYNNSRNNFRIYSIMYVPHESHHH